MVLLENQQNEKKTHLNLKKILMPIDRCMLPYHHLFGTQTTLKFFEKGRHFTFEGSINISSNIRVNIFKEIPALFAYFLTQN